MNERRCYKMADSCKKNLSPEQIFMEFGKDDDMGECNKCSNLEYSDGIMTCKLMKGSNDNDNKSN